MPPAIACLAVLIPTFNEGGRLEQVIDALAPQLQQHATVRHIVVVDDGSTNPTDTASLLKARSGAVVHLLRHDINMGQGASIQTALDYARDVLEADVFVTMDADGQHDPRDLSTFLARLPEVDVVFGNRFAGEGAMTVPVNRRRLLQGAQLFERLLTGLRLSDAHNGYRVFNRRFAEKLNMRQNRMAHATEIKQVVARHRLRYAEVPVVITYTAQTLAKGQAHTGSFSILKDLVRAYLFNG